jgi:mannose-6-phosphate isomerase-like protein (cupin superfamily)
MRLATAFGRRLSGQPEFSSEEVGYIVAGTVRMEIRDQPTLTLHPRDGGIRSTPAGTEIRTRKTGSMRPKALTVQRLTWGRGTRYLGLPSASSGTISPSISTRVSPVSGGGGT